MSSHSEAMSLLANKLGLGDEVQVIKKAVEFQRLLQTKLTTGNNMSDTGKAVICLDLAASTLGVDLDIKTAIKRSGWRPSIYINNKKIVENLLELKSEQLSVAMLCVSLQCGEVQNLAENILEGYQRQAKMEVDLNLPHYVCMAVYQACRLSKEKVLKSKLIEKSRLKPAQWAKLDADWTKFVDSNFAAIAKKKGTSKKIDKPTDGLGKTEVIETSIQTTKPIEESEQQIESYEAWKQRMLDKATKELIELEELETQKDTKIRRSPRKTPQKFAPYKSPMKANGIRLLFPTK